MRILHITAHMGGGAGNAISNMLSGGEAVRHCLICLQEPRKRQFIDKCAEAGVKILEEPSQRTILEEAAAADVTVLHWWHHPLMCGLLAGFPELPVRIVLWSHISGCAYPVLREEFAFLFDQVYFTSPYSYENREWSTEAAVRIRDRSRVVYGLGTPVVLPDREPKKAQDRFVIGYVGTLGKAKLHPDYLAYCREVIRRVPNTLFLMAGDMNEARWLLDEIREAGLEERFCFKGYCTDVAKELAQMDVFGYPLNPMHFGTTENVVLEAMSAGLPVIMLNQNTEKYIVKDGEDGMLVRTAEEYGEAAALLYSDPGLRERMGARARQAVFDKYDCCKNRAVFYGGLQDVMEKPKHSVDFGSVCGREPYEWFLYGLDSRQRAYFRESLSGDIQEKNRAADRIRNCREILKGGSKSSVAQFAEAFPEDQVLAWWRKLCEGRK